MGVTGQGETSEGTWISVSHKVISSQRMVAMTILKFPSSFEILGFVQPCDTNLAINIGSQGKHWITIGVHTSSSQNSIKQAEKRPEIGT